MFGESDTGESPRASSPWDALIFTPNPPSPKYIPKLVPEAEEGNIEYKLQLLAPSPARFAHLVTQLKWRLLEGGGQAYYELGVADSGALIGLVRADLEQTIETLECMAGEIGASVIIVKEVEVPKGMHVLGGDKAALFAGRAGKDRPEGKIKTWDAIASAEESEDTTATDDDGLFLMDKISLNGEVGHMQLSIDLEISTVYKPRPARISSSPSSSSTTTSSLSIPTRTTRSGPAKPKKTWALPGATATDPKTKKHNRRLARDRRREEKHNILVASAELAQIQRNTEENFIAASLIPLPASPNAADEILCAAENSDGEADEPRLIVEALVVRKLSLEEAFLDFGGFSLI